MGSKIASRSSRLTCLELAVLVSALKSYLAEQLTRGRHREEVLVLVRPRGGKNVSKSSPGVTDEQKSKKSQLVLVGLCLVLQIPRQNIQIPLQGENKSPSYSSPGVASKTKVKTFPRQSLARPCLLYYIWMISFNHICNIWATTVSNTSSDSGQKLWLEGWETALVQHLGNCLLLWSLWLSGRSHQSNCWLCFRQLSMMDADSFSLSAPIYFSS